VNAALKIDPISVAALILRAQIERQSGEGALAIQALSAAIKVQPDALDLRIARARAYAEHEQAELAEADFAMVRGKSLADADHMNALCWAEAAFPPFLDAARRTYSGAGDELNEMGVRP